MGSMNNTQILKNQLQNLQNKTVALVYIFEGEEKPRSKHFFIWKNDIISCWSNATSKLKCIPFLVDTSSFVDKAINHKLPDVDYVVDINSGTWDLSLMALVPSVCSDIAVPCIPSSAVTIVTGESKLLSNHIARSLGLNVPRDLPKEDKTGVFRPINYGNSMDVTIGWNDKYKDGLYQEFISGVEISTPLLYDPISRQLAALPTTMLIPSTKDPDWITSESCKKVGYVYKNIRLSESCINQFILLAQTIGVKSYCRIDARIKCADIDKLCANEDICISEKDVYFLEINVMPTIRSGNSFGYSYDSIAASDTLYPYLSELTEILGEKPDVHTFVLAASLLANSKPDTE